MSGENDNSEHFSSKINLDIHMFGRGEVFMYIILQERYTILSFMCILIVNY